MSETRIVDGITYRLNYRVTEAPIGSWRYEESWDGGARGGAVFKVPGGGWRGGHRTAARTVEYDRFETAAAAAAFIRQQAYEKAKRIVDDYEGSA